MLKPREKLQGGLRYQAIDRVPISTYKLIGWNQAIWKIRNRHYLQMIMNAYEYDR